MQCAIGLGSNLGNRLANLRQAREQILASPGWMDVPGSAGHPPQCASVYETDPVDCPPDSPAFLNTVLEVCVHPYASPTMILHRLQDIEAALGRPSRHPPNRPRVIDLDLLYFGRLELTSGELTVPHPRLRQRRFVLAPLAEIHPDLVLPGDRRTMAELLSVLPDMDGSRVARHTPVW